MVSLSGPVVRQRKRTRQRYGLEPRFMDNPRLGSTRRSPCHSPRTSNGVQPLQLKTRTGTSWLLPCLVTAPIPRPHLFPLFLTAIHATSVVQISTSLALGSRRPLPLWGRVLFQRHQEILHGMTSLGERPRGGEEASCTSAGESRRPVTVTRESAGLDSGVRGRPPAVSDHRAVWSCSVVSPQN